MTKNSTERLGGEYDLEPRGSAFFPAHQQESTQPFRASTKTCGIMLLLKGVTFSHYPLYCCSTVLEYLTCIFVISSRTVLLLHGVVFKGNLNILTLHIASSFAASVRSERVVPKNSRLAFSYSPASVGLGEGIIAWLSRFD